MRVFVVAIVACALGAGGVGAEEGAALKGDAVRSAVAGRHVQIHTAAGSLPIQFRPNGTMTGNALQLAALVGSETDSGTWWVANDRLCQRWNRWLEGRAHCATVWMSGRTMYWRTTDGRAGTATVQK